jgi:hypothetical protein
MRRARAGRPVVVSRTWQVMRSFDVILADLSFSLFLVLVFRGSGLIVRGLLLGEVWEGEEESTGVRVWVNERLFRSLGGEGRWWCW